MKVIIVGGVAGGASCAARLRRLDEKAEILMVERGPYVSYANCGLPYHVGGVIPKESSLLVASEQLFRAQFAIDVRTHCEAIAISPEKKTVELRNVATGEVTTESYDKLVLSPGAPSIRPPLPGIDLPGIFQVRTVPDARAIREWIERGTLFLAGMYNYSGIPVGEAQDPCGGDRRRVHRPRDGGEPRPSRVRGDPRRDARSGPGAARPGDARASSRASEAAWRPPGAQRRGGRIQAGWTSGALEVQHQIRQDVSGRHRDPRARRAPGHRRWRRRPAWRSANAAGSASTSTCARATRTSSPSAMPSRSRTS